MANIIKEIRDEIEALQRLGLQYPDDMLAQASIAGQIDVLEWTISKIEAGA